jgi:hypothetical protein
MWNKRKKEWQLATKQKEIDIDPDRHALDVDPDEDPEKRYGSDPIPIHNTVQFIGKSLSVHFVLKI